MDVIAFDTLKFTRRLMDSGVPRGQAEATAEALGEAIGESGWVTRVDIHALKLELVKWMVGLLIAQTALLITVFNTLGG